MLKKIEPLTRAETVARRLAELPPRLQKLNTDLAINRSKDYETLFATHEDHRFKIAVFRSGGGGFAATCKVGGRVHRYNGTRPSDAYIRLVKSLAWVTSKLDYEKNVALSRARSANAEAV